MTSKYKIRILELRKQGLGYRKIAKILGCSTSTVAYCVSPSTRKRQLDYNKKYYLNEHPYTRKLRRFRTKKTYRSNPRTLTNRNKHYYSLIHNKILNFERGYNNNMQPTTSILKVRDIIERFGENPTCYLTGDEIDICRKNSYQFDHMVPLSRGGSCLIDNLGIATKRANQSKYDMTVDEYIEHCKKVLRHNGYEVEKS